VTVDLAASSADSQESQRAKSGAVANPVEAGAVAKLDAAKPQWRRDTKSWLAEIERLRAAGDNDRADAELSEYKREHRAYATGAPDR
jgi:hypothetical protein